MPELKFPKPEEIAAKFDSCYRDSKDIVDLYNQENAGAEAKAIGKKLRQWVRVRAAQEGWAEVVFPTNYENPGSYIGAVFVRQAATDDD